MRRCLALAVLALAGCGVVPAPEPALLPGDVVRPQVVFTPEGFWQAGVKSSAGILVEVHRPGREGVSYLYEEDVPGVGVEMRGRITFLAGGVKVGEALDVPFVRDC